MQERFADAVVNWEARHIPNRHFGDWEEGKDRAAENLPTLKSWVSRLKTYTKEQTGNKTNKYNETCCSKTIVKWEKS